MKTVAFKLLCVQFKRRFTNLNKLNLCLTPRKYLYWKIYIIILGKLKATENMNDRELNNAKENRF